MTKLEKKEEKKKKNIGRGNSRPFLGVLRPPSV